MSGNKSSFREYPDEKRSENDRQTLDINQRALVKGLKIKMSIVDEIISQGHTIYGGTVRDLIVPFFQQNKDVSLQLCENDITKMMSEQNLCHVGDIDVLVDEKKRENIEKSIYQIPGVITVEPLSYISQDNTVGKYLSIRTTSCGLVVNLISRKKFGNVKKVFDVDCLTYSKKDSLQLDCEECDFSKVMRQLKRKNCAFVGGVANHLTNEEVPRCVSDILYAGYTIQNTKYTIQNTGLDEECPICLIPPRGNIVRFDECGSKHWMCMSCLLDMIARSQNGIIECHICRQKYDMGKTYYE